jgi:uncharacterized protein (TIGR00288 family)
MGMRSDLSKELKTLLNSDIIKGKVTVQRAYADWRRYPQYIVPLSENSVDLIFAPAYGSSKKNATDIRMAIDGMELVFIRPEIGTFILLTGDSDFSSLVLKLKEYGKYVIGVGIQESSSDILVQNCDEYYSYTSLTGLKKTTDSMIKAVDPWVLVEQAVDKMAARRDVMRSDRLKQVMIEIDPTFDEGNFGFSKFSRFLSEAASRDLVDLRKLDNGQYEVRPKAGKSEPTQRDQGSDQRKPTGKDRAKNGGKVGERDDRKGTARGKARGKTDPKPPSKDTETKVAEESDPKGGDPLQSAYGLLRQALDGLAEGDGGLPVRDSDLKRKMLELQPAFDEGELGFGKFSRFLRQAHDHEVVDLQKREEGTYQVSIRPGPGAGKEGEPSGDSSGVLDPPRAEPGAPDQEEKDPEGESGQRKGRSSGIVKGLGPRRGERKGRLGKDGPPPLLEGQVVSVGGDAVAQGASPSGPTAQAKTPDVSKMGLPSGDAAIISYLTNSYKGVGKKTAESLVKAFGSELFTVLSQDPGRITEIVSGRRAEQLLEAWKLDFQRRSEREGQGEGGQAPIEDRPEGSPVSPEAEEVPPTDKKVAPRRRTRRGGRSRNR